MEALIRIQKELKVPKDQQATYYKFRSAEGIFEAIKPLLQTAILTCSDTVIEVGPRVYVKATATLKEGPVSESCDGWAREQDQKKGLEAAQVTGGCSSYARKYALCGLFLIDNGLDPDAQQPDQPHTSFQETPWDQGQAPAHTNTPPASTPPPAANKQPPDGKVLAATPGERKWLRMLFDFIVAQAGGRQLDQRKLLKLSQMHLARYPNSMNDVEQLKSWIKLS